MKTAVIVNATRALAQAKVTKMASADKAKAIRAFKALKDESGDFDELLKEAQERLKPDGFDELNRKKQEGKLSENEQAEYNAMLAKYQEEVNLTLDEESRKDRELEFERLSAEAFDALVDSNDFTLIQIAAIEEALCGGEGKEE